MFDFSTVTRYNSIKPKTFTDKVGEFGVDAVEDLKSGWDSLVNSVDERAMKFAETTNEQGNFAGGLEAITQGGGAAKDFIQNAFTTGIKTLAPPVVEEGFKSAVQGVANVDNPITGNKLFDDLGTIGTQIGNLKVGDKQLNELPAEIKAGYKEWAKENPKLDIIARGTGNIAQTAIDLSMLKGAGKSLDGLEKSLVSNFETGKKRIGSLRDVIKGKVTPKELTGTAEEIVQASNKGVVNKTRDALTLDGGKLTDAEKISAIESGDTGKKMIKASKEADLHPDNPAVVDVAIDEVNKEIEAYKKALKVSGENVGEIKKGLLEKKIATSTEELSDIKKQILKTFEEKGVKNVDGEWKISKNSPLTEKDIAFGQEIIDGLSDIRVGGKLQDIVNAIEKIDNSGIKFGKDSKISETLDRILKGTRSKLKDVRNANLTEAERAEFVKFSEMKNFLDGFKDKESAIRLLLKRANTQYSRDLKNVSKEIQRVTGGERIDRIGEVMSSILEAGASQKDRTLLGNMLKSSSAKGAVEKTAEFLLKKTVARDRIKEIEKFLNLTAKQKPVSLAPEQELLDMGKKGTRTAETVNQKSFQSNTIGKEAESQADLAKLEARLKALSTKEGREALAKLKKSLEKKPVKKAVKVEVKPKEVKAKGVEVVKKSPTEKPKIKVKKLTKPKKSGSIDGMKTLEAEAKKYKSADEFVNNQPKVYRGQKGGTNGFIKNNPENTSKTMGEAYYFTTDKKLAEKYGKVQEIPFSEKNTLSVKDVQKIQEEAQKDLDELVGKKIYEGEAYDRAEDLTIGDYPMIAKHTKKPFIRTGRYNDTEILYFPEYDKTKSQLREIWNKAHKK